MNRRAFLLYKHPFIELWTLGWTLFILYMVWM